MKEIPDPFKNGLTFTVGKYVVVAREGKWLNKLLDTYKVDHADATLEDALKFLVEEGQIKLLDEHPGFAFGLSNPFTG
ncbi:hypothetical protein [Xanthomonas phage RTH11]|nr:hypothetical protein [Xanthomonas phage RTH11]